MDTKFECEVSTQERSWGRTWANLPTEGRLLVKCVGAMAALALLAYIANFAYFQPAPISAEPSHWGVFGDFLGGILNPVVAVCTLIGVWTAVKLQREELEKVNETVEKQNKLIQAQNTDAMFFRYLSVYSHCLAGIKLTSGPQGDPNPSIFSGADAIWKVLKHFPAVTEQPEQIDWTPIDSDDYLRNSFFGWGATVSAVVALAQFVDRLEAESKASYANLLSLSIESTVWRIVYFHYVRGLSPEIARLVSELDLMRHHTHGRAKESMKVVFSRA
jgi:hypothetical protein